MTSICLSFPPSVSENEIEGISALIGSSLTLSGILYVRKEQQSGNIRFDCLGMTLAYAESFLSHIGCSKEFISCSEQIL